MDCMHAIMQVVHIISFLKWGVMFFLCAEGGGVKVLYLKKTINGFLEIH